MATGNKCGWWPQLTTAETFISAIAMPWKFFCKLIVLFLFQTLPLTEKSSKLLLVLPYTVFENARHLVVLADFCFFTVKTNRFKSICSKNTIYLLQKTQFYVYSDRSSGARQSFIQAIKKTMRHHCPNSLHKHSLLTTSKLKSAVLWTWKFLSRKTKNTSSLPI